MALYDIKERGSVNIVALPLAASQTILKGMLLVKNSSGDVEVATNASTKTGIGVAAEDASSVGFAARAKTVQVITEGNVLIPTQMVTGSIVSADAGKAVMVYHSGAICLSGAAAVAPPHARLPLCDGTVKHVHTNGDVEVVLVKSVTSTAY